MPAPATSPTTLPLAGLSLARGDLDRGAARRADPALLASLLGDGTTRVLEVRAGRAPVLDAGGAPPRLALRPPRADDADADVVAYLGRDEDDVEHLAVVRVVDPQEGPEPGDDRWAGLREVGALLDDTGAGLLTAAVALGNWHATHPRCPRCGTATEVTQAGWTRRCPQDGSEHYPRTDPAVIMTVRDAGDRLLLGHQSRWPDRRFSTLAGFVEPGESLEQAVRREVLEEVGVAVDTVVYRGSQPWPFPASLMLGCHSWVAGEPGAGDVVVDGEEIVEARWWTREELAADLAAGRVLLPPRVSIARRLVEDWYGGELAAGETWR